MRFGSSFTSICELRKKTEPSRPIPTLMASYRRAEGCGVAEFVRGRSTYLPWCGSDAAATMITTRSITATETIGRWWIPAETAVPRLGARSTAILLGDHIGGRAPLRYPVGAANLVLVRHHSWLAGAQC
jgi:hypothetical protein